MAKKRQPATPPPASAAPGTEDATATKEKVEKIQHPATRNGEEVVLLKAVPEDFDSKVHIGLKKKDFECEGTFYDMKAAEYTAKAEACTKAAADARAMGSVADRAKVRRLQRVAAQMASLKKELEGTPGIDVDALLASAEEAAE